MYVNSHFVITTTFLIWLYLARNEAYYFVRNMFMVAMGLALVGYVVYPDRAAALPARVGLHRHRRAASSARRRPDSANVLYNPYAAVPSMHVAFALMIGIPARKLVQAPLAARSLWGSTRCS